ncbi:hypothetical protein EYF80_000692 [Liparis tanakae]|uniref:Uncharacterized protein n=1 Tax=Liparis tanakae TaxID=230148 RepID=A0A4Z2JEX0_9TELE|nr:hypothetical protein EYF80_000692 [Liparis tanakae]
MIQIPLPGKVHKICCEEVQGRQPALVTHTNSSIHLSGLFVNRESCVCGTDCASSSPPLAAPRDLQEALRLDTKESVHSHIPQEAHSSVTHSLQKKIIHMKRWDGVRSPTESMTVHKED